MIRRLDVFVALGLALAACGGGGGKPTNTTPAPTKPAAPDLSTAEGIMEASLAAQGGRDKLGKLKSVKQTGTVLIPQVGLKGTVTIISAPPRNSLITLDIAGFGKAMEGVSGDIAWSFDPSSGGRILKDAERDVSIREATFNADLVWKELYPKAELGGVVDFNGTQAYKITLTAKEGDTQVRFFAKDTLLPVGSQQTRDTQMGKLPLETNVSDYRDVNGLKYPFKLVQKAGPQNIEFALTSVEHDVALPPDTFALPPQIAALQK